MRDAIESAKAEAGRLQYAWPDEDSLFEWEFAQAGPVKLTPAAAMAALIVLGLALCLWTSLAYGFYFRMHPEPWLEAGATVFFLLFGGVVLAYAARATRVLRRGLSFSDAPSAPVRVVLALAIPSSILAMSFACGFPGCTPLCRALTGGAIVMGGLAVTQAVRGGVAPLLLLGSVAYAVPHCTCVNPINVAWIEALGTSPDCFGLPLVATAIATLGLCGVWPRLSAVLSFLPAGAAAAFAYAHHVLHYPW